MTDFNAESVGARVRPMTQTTPPGIDYRNPNRVIGQTLKMTLPMTAEPPLTAQAFEAAERFEQEWLERVTSSRADRRPRWVQRSWRRLDRGAGMPEMIR